MPAVEHVVATTDKNLFSHKDRMRRKSTTFFD
jgi:hypothetical protein